MARAAFAPKTAPWIVPPIPGWRRSALTAHERATAAYHAAQAAGHLPLAETYRHAARKDNTSARQEAIASFARRAGADARTIRCSDVRALRQAGLNSSDIEDLARLIAMVSYQASVLGPYPDDCA